MEAYIAGLPAQFFRPRRHPPIFPGLLRQNRVCGDTIKVLGTTFSNIHRDLVLSSIIRRGRRDRNVLLI